MIDYLYENKERNVTQKDIEKSLVIGRATTSKMLLLLEQKGFVERISNKEDARRKTVILTSKGIEFREFNLKWSRELDDFLNEVLSEEDFIAFNRIYEKLKKAMDK